MQLEDTIAVVTGAGRGIGKAIAVPYAREGAKVVCAARSADEIDAVAKEAGGLAVPCDVAEEGEIIALMERTLARYGRSGARGASSTSRPAPALWGRPTGPPTRHPSTG